MKRTAAFLLACVFVLSLAACGGKTETTSGGNTPAAPAAQIEDKTWYSADDCEEYFKDLQFDKELDVASVYANVEYNEQMLTGCYKLEKDEDSDLQKFADGAGTMSLEYYNATLIGESALKTATVTALPYKVITGAGNIADNAGLSTPYSGVSKKTDDNLALLYFLNEQNKPIPVLCTYTVSGTGVEYFPVTFYEKIETDDEKDYDGDCNYTPGTKGLRYSFGFSGPYFTLSDGSASTTLCGKEFCPDKGTKVKINAYALPDSARIGDIVQMGSIFNSSVLRDGTNVNRFYIRFESSGLATMVWDDGSMYNVVSTGKEVHHYQKQVVYWQTGNGLMGNQFIFADEDQVFYYTDDYKTHNTRELNGYYDGDVLNKLTDEQFKKIESTKNSLFDELVKEFEENDIRVNIDRSLGEIALDNSVLFSGDSSEISAEGKAFLNRFVKIYTDVIYGGKYANSIEKVVIEGHTAPLANSTYESGLPLSTQRAENVKVYCLSAEVGLTGAAVKLFKDSLEARGLSNSKPIYGEDGEIDLDACRRVSFTFIVKAQ